MCEASEQFLSLSTVKPQRFNFPTVQRLPKYRFEIWSMTTVTKNLNRLITSNLLGH